MPRQMLAPLTRRTGRRKYLRGLGSSTERGLLRWWAQTVTCDGSREQPSDWATQRKESYSSELAACRRRTLADKQPGIASAGRGTDAPRWTGQPPVHPLSFPIRQQSCQERQVDACI